VLKNKYSLIQSGMSGRSRHIALFLVLRDQSWDKYKAAEKWISFLCERVSARHKKIKKKSKFNDGEYFLCFNFFHNAAVYAF
jgi:Na+-transporting NADH:ubiquinone oxidoreductase subunit NqrF